MTYSVMPKKTTKKPGRKQKRKWRAQVRHGWCSETRTYATDVSHTFPTEASAHTWAVETEEMLLGNKQVRHGIRRGATVRDMINHYIEQGEWKSLTTINRYNNYRNASLADAPCLTLTQKHFKQLQRDLKAKGLADTTIGKHLNGWKAIVNHGVRTGFLEFNPWINVKTPSAHNARERTPTDAEIDAFIAASGYGAHIGPVRNVTEASVCMWCIACITGLRQNEILEARTDWLTVDGQVILHIPAHIAKNGKGRAVPIENAALKHLLRSPPDEITGRYFEYMPRAIRRAWSDVRDKLGIPGRGEPGGMVFHDSRHRAVTDLLGKLKPFEVMAMVGHSDYKMLGKYSQPDPQDIGRQLEIGQA